MQNVILKTQGLNTGKTVELDPNMAEFFIQKAMGYKRTGKFDSYYDRFQSEAKEDYNEGVEIIYQLVNKNIKPKGYRNATRMS